MSNQQKVLELMQRLADGRQAANEALVVEPGSRRVRAMPVSEAVKRDLTPYTPQDMRVSAARARGARDIGSMADTCEGLRERVLELMSSGAAEGFARSAVPTVDPSTDGLSAIAEDDHHGETRGPLTVTPEEMRVGWSASRPMPTTCPQATNRERVTRLMNELARGGRVTREALVLNVGKRRSRSVSADDAADLRCHVAMPECPRV